MRTREQLETTAKLRALARWLGEREFAFYEDDEWANVAASDVLDALRELEALRDEVNRLRKGRSKIVNGHPPSVVVD